MPVMDDNSRVVLLFSDSHFEVAVRLSGDEVRMPEVGPWIPSVLPTQSIRIILETCAFIQIASYA